MKTISELIRYGMDASGHEHVGKGVPEGGQFTRSPHELASSLSEHRGDEKQVQQDRVSEGASKGIKEIANYLAEYGEDDPMMPANLMNEVMVNADIDKEDRQAVLDDLFNKGFVQLAEGSSDENQVFEAGPSMKAVMGLKEYAAADEEGTISNQQIQNMLLLNPEDVQPTIDILFDAGFLETGPDDNTFQITKFSRGAIKTIDELIRYADASGHEHVGKGVPEGGQFTKSPNELAESLSTSGESFQTADAGKDAIASVQNYIDNITKGGASSAKIEEALAPLTKVPAAQLAEVAAGLKIAGRVKSRKALVDQLRQVMTNLSTNWVKYGPRESS